MFRKRKQLTIEERMVILNEEILKYQRKGWIVMDKAATSAQLKKPAKKYGCLQRAMFGLLLLFTPRHDEYLFLEVTERGRVKRKKRKR